MYVNGTRTSKIVEKLGTVAELEKTLNGEDPIEWAKKYIEELNKKEKEEKRDILVKYSPAKQIVKKVIDTNPKKLKKSNANDYKRFISKAYCTPDGELADKELYGIDTELIAQESAYDGFYAVCTNLEDDASDIIKVNRRRWEIEESFRIMKTEFKARPVYLQRDDRIKAHFTTCFISLLIYRLLEKKLTEKYTCSDIISGLRSMNFYEVKGEGYIPTYTRTDFTDDLHDKFDFRTDYQIVNTKQMKNILKITKP